MKKKISNIQKPSLSAQDLAEFDLINPYAEEVPYGGAKDKDFEPKDPGWLYPDPPKSKQLIDPVDVIQRLDNI